VKIIAKLVIALALCIVIAGCNNQYHSANDSYLSKIHAYFVSSVQIVQKISKKSEKKTKIGEDIDQDALYSESVQGRAILSALERGDPQAIANYPRLRDTPNVEWTEALDYSMAVALTRNSKGVLAMADTPERLDIFCSPPFIEPAAGVERAYLRAALKALRAIGNASPMVGRRDACVKRLSAMMGG